MDDEPDIGNPAQLSTLADVLANSLHAGKEELERSGNPAKLGVKDYLLGCASVIATIREIARIQASGHNPFATEPSAEQTEQAIKDLLGEMGGS